MYDVPSNTLNAFLYIFQFQLNFVAEFTERVFKPRYLQSLISHFITTYTSPRTCFTLSATSNKNTVFIPNKGLCNFIVGIIKNNEKALT